MESLRDILCAVVEGAERGRDVGARSVEDGLQPVLSRLNPQ